MRPSGRILMNRQQSRDSSALGVHPADKVSGALGRDHYHVDVVRRLNGLEMDAETVRDPEHLAGMQVRLDLRVVKVALRLVGREDLDPVGALRGFRGSDYHHAVGACLLGRGPLRVQADDDLVSAVAQVLGLRMALAAVAQDGDGLSL